MKNKAETYTKRANLWLVIFALCFGSLCGGFWLIGQHPQGWVWLLPGFIPALVVAAFGSLAFVFSLSYLILASLEKRQPENPSSDER